MCLELGVLREAILSWECWRSCSPCRKVGRSLEVMENLDHHQFCPPQLLTGVFIAFQCVIGWTNSSNWSSSLEAAADWLLLWFTCCNYRQLPDWLTWQTPSFSNLGYSTTSTILLFIHRVCSPRVSLVETQRLRQCLRCSLFQEAWQLWWVIGPWVIWPSLALATCPSFSSHHHTESPRSWWGRFRLFWKACLPAL